MSITDELREYSKTTTSFPAIFKELTDIADRIDEQRENDAIGEYTRGYNAGFNAASAEVESADELRERMEREYTKLPVDADGVPIKVGDVMEWPTTGETFEVVGIGDGTLFYVEDGSECADWTGATTKRHHHEPTVEDVLREFAEKMNENMGMYTGEAIDADEWRDADRQTIAEYASKLRLAGEVE